MYLSKNIRTAFICTATVLVLCILFMLYIFSPEIRYTLSQKNTLSPITIINSTAPTLLPALTFKDGPSDDSILIPSQILLTFSNLPIFYRKYCFIIDGLAIYFGIYILFNYLIWRYVVGIVCSFHVLKASLILFYVDKKLSFYENRFEQLKKEKNIQAMANLRQNLILLNYYCYLIFTIIYPLGINFFRIKKYFYFYSDKMKLNINYLFASIMDNDFKIEALINRIDSLII